MIYCTYERCGSQTVRSCEVMVFIVKIIMAYLESQSTITRIVLKPDKEGSFLMKSMEIKLHWCSEIKSCLKSP